MSTSIFARPLRWGILGTGTIAKAFARGLAQDPACRLEAVGSRSAGSAAAFAGEFPCRAHGDYTSLCADPGVDVVYIASPHQAHREHALLAIAHGKHVLVEKPFALNRNEAAEIFAAAQAANVFAMEAMWTRCLPAHRQVAAWLAAGVIGEARMVRADFGFRAAWDPESRLLSPALAGGALLDVGVYVVAFALGVLGRAPQRIQACAFLGKTGVDEQAAVLLDCNRFTNISPSQPFTAMLWAPSPRSPLLCPIPHPKAPSMWRPGRPAA